MRLRKSGAVDAPCLFSSGYIKAGNGTGRMKINLIVVGKVKEKYLRDAIQ